MDVAPDGRARLVTRGGQRLGEGPEAVPIEPDEQGPVHVDLRPKSHVFEAGHRLRLAISAADMPRHFPIGPDGEFTVVSEPEAPTTVSFPGELEPPVPHPDEITVPEPDDRLPFGPPGVEDQEVTGATTRGHHDGSLSFRREVHADTTYEAVDRTVSVSRDVSVTADDPESVAGELRYTSELHYPTEPVKVTAETKMTREALELSLTVTVDGDPKFDATWAE